MQSSVESKYSGYVGEGLLDEILVQTKLCVVRLTILQAAAFQKNRMW